MKGNEMGQETNEEARRRETAGIGARSTAELADKWRRLAEVTIATMAGDYPPPDNASKMDVIRAAQVMALRDCAADLEHVREIESGPECVKRWRALSESSQAAVLATINGYCLDDPGRKEVKPGGAYEHHCFASQCLNWLIAAPNPGAVVVASSSGADVLREGQRVLKKSPLFWDAFHFATIIDRGELVAWLRSWDNGRFNVDMPPVLRVLLDGEGS